VDEGLRGVPFYQRSVTEVLRRMSDDRRSRSVYLRGLTIHLRGLPETLRGWTGDRSGPNESLRGIEILGVG